MNEKFFEKEFEHIELEENCFDYEDDLYDSDKFNYGDFVQSDVDYFSIETVDYL